MQINKHGSFYIRTGWPTKILDAVATDPRIFSPNSELNAVDTIGVGRVMIKAMRYWSTVLGLSDETKDQQGVIHTLSNLASMIEKYDPFFSDIGSLWLLHRNLARCKDDATAWYWAFNIFDETSFTKNDFSASLYSFLQQHGTAYNLNTVEKEFDCFKNTYVSDETFSVSKTVDEDTVPFFSPLRLIEHLGGGVYQRRKIPTKEIPAKIMLAFIIMDNKGHLETNSQIGLDHLLEEPCQICKYMNLSYSTLIEVLQKLENAGYLRLVNNFGNRYIELQHIDENTLLSEHYCVDGR